MLSRETDVLHVPEAMKLVLLLATVNLVLSTAHPLIKSFNSPCKIDTSCDNSSYDLQNFTISFAPDPPKEGQSMTITASGILNKVITGGSIEVTVFFNSMIISHQTFDTCNDIKTIHKQCPLPKGYISASTSTAIPKDIAEGTYTIHVTGTDQDGGNLLCGSATCEIKKFL